MSINNGWRRRRLASQRKEDLLRFYEGRVSRAERYSCGIRRQGRRRLSLRRDGDRPIFFPSLRFNSFFPDSIRNSLATSDIHHEWMKPSRAVALSPNRDLDKAEQFGRPRIGEWKRFVRSRSSISIFLITPLNLRLAYSKLSFP